MERVRLLGALLGKSHLRAPGSAITLCGRWMAPDHTRPGEDRELCKTCKARQRKMEGAHG